MGLSSRSARARPAPAPESLVTVARVVRPHGLRGEVRARLETDFPDRFQGLREAYLVRAGRADPVEITGARRHGDGVLLTIRGIEDPAAAGRLRGAAIAVPREAAVGLDPGQFYVFEIIGLRVRAEDGGVLGTVVEVRRGPAHDVYVVRDEDGEVLLPAIREVVHAVDVAAGEMVVALPAGLEVTRGAR